MKTSIIQKSKKNEAPRLVTGDELNALCLHVILRHEGWVLRDGQPNAIGVLMSKPHDYAKSVFINCPFDKDYEPLLRAMVFAVRNLKLKPRSAMHLSDGGQPRINKILELIENCRFSIHDICRTELDPVHGLPRFNMPFELGLDLGCKRYRKS